MALTPVVVADRTGAAQSMDMFQDGNSFNIPVVSIDTTKVTYRCGANFTPFATSALTVVNFQGSATKTCRIRKITLCHLATTVSQGLWAIQRTSTQGTGGTAVAPTIGTLDRGPAAVNPAATAVVQHFTTAAQSRGTSVGGALSTFVTNATLAQGSTPTALSGYQMVPVWPDVSGLAQSMVVRGTADFLELANINAGNLGAGSTLTYNIEWEEDGS